MGCSAPKTYLDDYIEERGFIPYVLKIDNTRVGTFYEAGNNNLQLVQEAEFCMPDRAVEPFRTVQNTSLDKEYKKVQLAFNANVNDALKSGNSSVSLNLSASHIKTVEIEFGQATIERLIKNNLMEHYRTRMSDRCKRLFENNAFVNNSLRVESMSFRFMSSSGGLIDLTSNINQVVDIDANVEWKVENKYTLVINSHKAIGYTMAQLNSNGELDYGVRTDSRGHWIFKKESEVFFQGLVESNSRD